MFDIKALVWSGAAWVQPGQYTPPAAGLTPSLTLTPSASLTPAGA